MTSLVVDPALARTISAEQSELQVVTLGESVSAYDSIGKNPADNKYWRTDGISTGLQVDFAGYALQNGAADEKIGAQLGGTIYLGVAAAEGMLYVVGSDTPGGTENAVEALATSGLLVNMIGYGDEDGNIVIKRILTGKSIA